MNGQKLKANAFYENLKSRIAAGLLPPGTKLPSETECMQVYEISRYSVRKVLSKLEEEGLIQKKQGMGCFVFQPDLYSFGEGSSQILLIASRVENFYFLKSITGIEKALMEEGYTLTIKLSNYDSRTEAELLNKAFSEHYAGLLIFPSESAYLHTNLHLYRYIEERKIPCISLGNRLCSTGIPSVTTDDYTGGRIAAAHLVENGHRSFVCLMNQEEYSGCMRYAGFSAGLHEMKISHEKCRIFWFGHTEIDSLFTDKADQLLKLAENATAFFCFNDAAAVSLYQLFARHGIRVPQDVSIIGYDDSYLCEINPVPLTALHQDPETAGYTAAKNLIRLIQDKDFDCNKVFLPYLVERDSVADLLA